MTSVLKNMEDSNEVIVEDDIFLFFIDLTEKELNSKEN